MDPERAYIFYIRFGNFFANFPSGIEPVADVGHELLIPNEDIRLNITENFISLKTETICRCVAGANDRRVVEAPYLGMQAVYSAHVHLGQKMQHLVRIACSTKQVT